MDKRNGVLLGLGIGLAIGFGIARWTQPRLDNCAATLYVAVVTSTPPSTSVNMRSLEGYCAEHPLLRQLSR
jgi:hypothetical protein